MPKYNVRIAELHYSTRQVEADSPEEAEQKVADGEGEELFMEFGETLDSGLYPWVTYEDDTAAPKAGSLG